VFKTGDQIGSYSLIEKLGRGAFGEVWLAEEKTAISTHKAALKLPNESDVDLEAIRQEADVWEQVKGHPNILPIIKADIYEGQIYIASEYAPDGSLSEWLKNHDGKAPTVELAVAMIKGILSGLEHLHSKGVIHRDLKPANILLQADTPRIADFGIARLAKTDATGNTLSAGTPSYMAPECFYSVRSEQTDIWAVGVLFHKLLTDKLPFSHPDQVSVMNAILNDEPQIDSEIPEYLQQVIRKALEKDTSARYKTAAEMRLELNNFNPAIFEDEDTIAQPATAAVASAATVIPIKSGAEKEEETVVHPKRAVATAATASAPMPQIVHIQEEANLSSSGGTKTLVIGLTAFLVLLGITAWAAMNYGGNNNESDSRPGFSNLSNQSSESSNFTIDRNSGGLLENRTTDIKSLEGANVSAPSVAVPSYQSPSSVTTVESNTAESGNNNQISPAATPFEVQPDETSNVNIKPRVTRGNQTPAEDSGVAPQPTLKPVRSPLPVPIESDVPKISPPPQRPGNRPTPRSQPKTEETPPPMDKSEGTDGN
jgi:serine/threonine-protein kinase